MSYDRSNKTYSTPFWRVDAFHSGQREVPDGSYWWNNAHRVEKSIVFHYVIKGTLVFVRRQKRQDVQQGWGLLFAHGENSAYGLPASYDEPLLTSWAVLSGAGTLEHWNAIRQRFGSVVHIGQVGPLRRAMNRLGQHVNPSGPAEAELAATAVHTFVMRLYGHLESQQIRSRPPVERAVDELLQYPTYPWSLKEVAARHGCSREHLTRVFTERVGVPPAAYLSLLRLKKALDLLRETSLPIRRVAEQSGFSSVHTMVRWVRAETGKAPGMLREAVRSQSHKLR